MTKQGITRRLEKVRWRWATQLLERWQRLTPEQALCAILDLAPEQLPDWNAPWSEADQTAWEALQASVPPPQPEAVRYKRLARQFATQGLSEEWRQIFQRAGILRIPEDS